MRFLIAIPLLLVVVLFALSNTQTVHLGLWPLPADFAVDAPLSIIVLAGMAIAFMLGALELWFTAVGARRRARRAEHQVKLLEAQVQELKARNAAPVAPAAPTSSLPVTLPSDRRG
jgi:lipopolysaccharide assembly protein A